MSLEGTYAGTSDPVGGGYLKAAMLRLVKDSSVLAEADHDQAVALALADYNRDRPRELVVDIPGDGGYDYPLPSAWVYGYSSVKSVEYPAGEREPVYLQPEEWTLYVSPSATTLRLANLDPDVGETIRLTFTVPRDDDTTVPKPDVDAVASLAASYCYETLANHYVKSGNSSIQADAVDYRSKSSEASSRAKALRKIYERHVGIDRDSSPRASSVTTDYDTNYPGGADRLTHRRRYF